jgi:hypothetical protein
MTRETAVDEAQKYVEKLIQSQAALGYKQPTQRTVRSAVSEATKAVEGLASLARSS